jgi:hypothetical protein
VADIEKMASRPRDYLSETGLPLLTGGLIFIILGGGVLIQQLLPRGSVAQLVMQWIGVCCSGVVFFGANVLRRRIVFLRGGYVVPRIQPSSRAILLGGLVVVAGLGIFVFALPGRLHLVEDRFIPPGFAICVAISLSGRLAPEAQSYDVVQCILRGPCGPAVVDAWG